MNICKYEWAFQHRIVQSFWLTYQEKFYALFLWFSRLIIHGTKIFTVLFKVIHQTLQEHIFPHSFRVANNTALPACTCYSHIHPPVVAQKSHLHIQTTGYPHIQSSPSVFWSSKLGFKSSEWLTQPTPVKNQHCNIDYLPKLWSIFLNGHGWWIWHNCCSHKVGPFLPASMAW